MLTQGWGNCPLKTENFQFPVGSPMAILGQTTDKYTTEGTLIQCLCFSCFQIATETSDGWKVDFQEGGVINTQGVQSIKMISENRSINRKLSIIVS